MSNAKKIKIPCGAIGQLYPDELLHRDDYQEQMREDKMEIINAFRTTYGFSLPRCSKILPIGA